MKIAIRAYTASDYDLICSWWKEQKEPAPSSGMMVEDGTFVLECEDMPVLTLTALYTQSKKVAFLEGYCAKPKLDPSLRNLLGEILWSHAISYLKNLGFLRVNILTDKEALVRRYQKLGMHLQLSGLHSLGREI